MSIFIDKVHKSFGSFTALQGISLDIASGELLALLGPSGSGKTTLLRIIAGLEQADSGRILLDGENVASRNVRERNVGFMFQHYALFRHLSVFDNVAFGLHVRPRSQRPDKAAIGRRVRELLSLVRLEGLEDRYPAQLSGGQRQRVALARALATEPRVLLLDEPFGALDAKVRKELRRFMRQLHETIHVTTVFVTHDQDEAMEVADRVVVMSHGAIEQVGTPSEVWQAPANGFVYDFLGHGNAFEGWRDDHGQLHLAEYDVVLQPGVGARSQVAERLAATVRGSGRTARWLQRVVPLLARPGAKAAHDPQRATAEDRAVPAGGVPVQLYARPHELCVVREANGHNEYIAARVLHLNPAGSLVKLELERRDGRLIQAELTQSEVEEQGLEKGLEVLVRPKRLRCFE